MDRHERTVESLFLAMADPTRRAVLRHLDGNAVERTTASALADVLATAEPTRGGAMPDERDRIRVALHHVHLPKLAAQGLVEYESGSGGVRYVGDERVGKLLRFTEEELV